MIRSIHIFLIFFAYALQCAGADSPPVQRTKLQALRTYLIKKRWKMILVVGALCGGGACVWYVRSSMGAIAPIKLEQFVSALQTLMNAHKGASCCCEYGDNAMVVIRLQGIQSQIMEQEIRMLAARYRITITKIEMK